MASSGAAAAGTAYESIATATASGSVSTLSFTSITSGFKHLQIRGMAYDGAGNELGVRFNSDTATNYSYHGLYGTGAVTSAFGYATQNVMQLAAAGYTSNYMAVFIMDILDYGSTSKYKTVRSFYGFDNNGSGQVQLRSGLWRSTSAITGIEIYNTGATNYANTTTFALYGIKEA